MILPCERTPAAGITLTSDTCLNSEPPLALGCMHCMHVLSLSGAPRVAVILGSPW
jgi:hypothetical protein